MSSQAAGGQPQGAGKGSVTFTRQAAQRIAKVVRTVEQGDRTQPGVTFDHPIHGSGGKNVRVVTVTGQWATAATAVVTFYNVTSTPNTVSATNLYLPIDVDAGKTAECVIARGGTAWYLASVNFTKLKAFAAGEVQVFGHNTSGYAQWYSVTTCSTSTAA
jgi:hypothetical protein